MTRGMSDVVSDTIANIKKTIAHMKDPMGIEQMYRKDKSDSLADIAFIQRLRNDQSVLSKPVKEVLDIIKKEMVSKPLISMHDFYAKRLPQAEGMGTAGFLLRLEEAVTNFMTRMSNLWHNKA